MINKENKLLIEEYFNELLPSAKCELNYNKDYELLIAVTLSAQVTDKKVNKVTEVLFNKYKNLDELNSASIEDIEEIIKELGLYKAKANAIKDITNKLINNFNYKVPDDKKDLMSMKGVGNKVANVILIELFDRYEFPVDTHVFRVSKRLNIANKNDSIEVVEEKLKKTFEKEKYKKLHHQFIHFGRYYCLARNPKCENCKLKNICEYYKENF